MNQNQARGQAAQNEVIRFIDLFIESDIQRIQDEFALATGVASIITYPDGTPITKPSRFTRLCSEIIRTTTIGCANCFRSDAALGIPHPGGPIVQPCLSGGLWDAGTSINVGGQHIANWLIGQVRDESQTDEAMRAYAREIGVDEEIFLEAFHEVPSMSLERFKQAAQLLHTIANQLSTSAYLNLQQARLIRVATASEEKLRESEERFRGLYDNASIGLYRTTPDGRIILFNPAAVRMLGYESFEELKDRNLEDEGFEPSYHRREFRERLERDGKIVGLESVWARRDGTKRIVRESAIVVRDFEGRPLYYDGTVEDITERKEAEEAMRRSEEQYRYMFENNPQPMWIYDVESLAFVQVNNAAVEHYGYSKEEFLSMTIKDIRPNEEVGKLLSDIQSTERTLNQAGEWVHCKKNGELINVEIMSHAVTFNNRPARHVLVHDVTDKKKAEASLRESQALYHSFVEHIPAGVFRKDMNGRYVFVNSRFCQYIGLTEEQIIGKKREELLAHHGAEEGGGETGARQHASGDLDIDYHAEIMRTGKPMEVEEVYYKPDGTRQYLQVMRSPVFSSDGKVIGSQGIQFDITQMKSLERQLVQAQKLEGIGTLAGGVAHEFNNLLAMILGSAELLRPQLENNPKLQRYVDRIIESSERGAGISRQLLIFSRPEQSEMKPISLSQIITEIREMLLHFLPKSIEIKTSIDVNNGIIMGDAGQMHQAILNLAINAGDAMLNGGTLTISESMAESEMIRQRFGYQSDIPFVAVSISDTGTGIEPSMLQKIFDPFFSTKERGKGTGLGLSIVHGIVNNHRGFIHVDSTPGKGTTFTMYFPSYSLQVSEKRPANNIPGSLYNETLLIVDDETMIRESLEEFLISSGYRVLTAANGREAVEMYQAHRESIKLVITDLGMPQMGGEELFRHLQKLDPAVKVIASSGYLDGATKAELRHMGFRDILTKPYKMDVIKSAIHSVLDEDIGA